MDNYVPVNAWIFWEVKPAERGRERQWKPLQRHSPAKLPKALEWRPQWRRLLKWRESPLWQPREIALKGHSHRAPGAGPAPRHPVAERRRKGVSHMMGAGMAAAGQPSNTRDKRVSVCWGFWKPEKKLRTNLKRWYLCREERKKSNFYPNLPVFLNVDPSWCQISAQSCFVMKMMAFVAWDVTKVDKDTKKLLLRVYEARKKLHHAVCNLLWKIYVKRGGRRKIFVGCELGCLPQKTSGQWTSANK